MNSNYINIYYWLNKLVAYNHHESVGKGRPALYTLQASACWCHMTIDENPKMLILTFSIKIVLAFGKKLESVPEPHQHNVPVVDMDWFQKHSFL